MLTLRQAECTLRRNPLKTCTYTCRYRRNFPRPRSQCIHRWGTVRARNSCKVDAAVNRQAGLVLIEQGCARFGHSLGTYSLRLLLLYADPIFQRIHSDTRRDLEALGHNVTTNVLHSVSRRDLVQLYTCIRLVCTLSAMVLIGNHTIIIIT